MDLIIGLAGLASSARRSQVIHSLRIFGPNSRRGASPPRVLWSFFQNFLNTGYFCLADVGKPKLQIEQARFTRAPRSVAVEGGIEDVNKTSLI